MAHYWISKNKSFGRNIKFGDEVEGLDKDRAKDLIGKGLVSEKKPETVTTAEKNKIAEISAVNESLREDLAELKEEMKKGGSAKLKEARATIEELTKQLEEATAPEKKGGK